jgi:hypothetical protein
MRYLYLLLLFSLGALLWAAFSIARHIRKHGRHANLSTPAEPKAVAANEVSDPTGMSPQILMPPDERPQHETETLTDKQSTNGSQQ